MLDQELQAEDIRAVGSRAQRLAEDLARQWHLPCLHQLPSMLPPLATWLMVVVKEESRRL